MQLYIKSEINRIADSANFNGIKLLDGTQGAFSCHWWHCSIKLNADTDAVEGNGSGQKGVYSIDISKWAGSAGSAAASFSIKIGGVTIAKANISAGKTGDASAIKIFVQSVSINGVDFEVKLDNGKIILSMKSVPTTKFDTSMAVTDMISFTMMASRLIMKRFPRGLADLTK